jgi:hypothetical protein
MSYVHDEPLCGANEAVEARRLYETFYGSEPAQTRRERFNRIVPSVLVDLGSLRGLIYSKRTGDGPMRTFIHFMENPPRLVCDAAGRRLFVIGGSYRITRRGIEG